MDKNKSDELAVAYRKGYEAGKKHKETKFPDGVDWHIIGTRCDCQEEIIPVADNAGEDIYLYEKLDKLKEMYKDKCDGCHKFVKIFHVEGNMASKK
jgi:hypothetical protein